MNLIYLVFKIKFLFLALPNICQSIQVQQCPELQTYQNVRIAEGYVIQSFVKIAKTNILMINTIQQTKQDSSIVYYNDLSVQSGEIINVIKPDYPIINMIYLEQYNKILASNQEKVVLVDVYNLKPEKSIQLLQIQSIELIQDTNLVIITKKYYLLLILDLKSFEVVATLDSSSNFISKDEVQYQSKFYQLFNKKQQKFIMTHYKQVFISWSYDPSTHKWKFLEDLLNTNGDVRKENKSITRLPNTDIFFFCDLEYAIQVIEIIDIETNEVNSLADIKLNGQSDSLQQLFNVALKYIELNGQKVLFLIAGDDQYIYTAQLAVDLTKKTFKVAKKGQQQLVEVKREDQVLRWYDLQDERKLVIGNSKQAIVYDYQQKQSYYNLWYLSDSYNKAISFTNSQEQQLYVFLQQKQLVIAEKGNFGKAKMTYSLSNSLLKNYNSAFQVKFCQHCLAIKTVNDNQEGAFLTQIDLSKEFEEQILFTYLSYLFQQMIFDFSNFGIDNWNQFSYIDFFFHDNTVFAIVSQQEAGYLFVIINLSSQSFYQLFSESDNDSKNSGLCSVIQQITNDKYEIIGLDNLGYVYTWSFPDNKIKYFYKMNDCLNPSIAELMSLQDGSRRVIVYCKDGNIFSYNFDKGTDQQVIWKLTSQPLTMKVQANLLFFGEKDIGDIFIFKYDESKKDFQLFLQFQSGVIKNTLIWIDLLKNNQLWIQYQYINIFFQLDSCFNDPKNCQQCSKQFYFNVTEKPIYEGFYGSGIKNNPYSSSSMFFQKIVQIQYYKDLIKGVSNIIVDNILDSSSQFEIKKEFMNFDFTSIISLQFKSNQTDKNAVIQYNDQLLLSNYQSFSLENINLNFSIQDGKQCGIRFQNITNQAYLLNLKIVSNMINCYYFIVDSSQLNIKDLYLDSLYFKENRPVIQASNTDKINIENLVINNCTLGQDFSVLSQLTDISANLTKVQISNNKVLNTQQNSNVLSSLFSAAQIYADKLDFYNNVFKNKIMFTIVSSIKQQNQTFTFKAVNITKNEFYSRMPYIFFNSLYSMLYNPDHNLYFEDITFEENIIVQQDNQDLPIASFIETDKIKLIDMKNIRFKNHYNIKLMLNQNTYQIFIDGIFCENSDEFKQEIPQNQMLTGCFQINEASQIFIKNINVNNLIVKNQPVISIQNFKQEYLMANITIGNFNTTSLIQTEANQYASMIQINSYFMVDIFLNKCNFTQNSLNSDKFILVYSASALYLQSYKGNSNITDCYFQNSYSNSKYNFVYLQSKEVYLQNVHFQKSSFFMESDTLPKNFEEYQQQGGMLNLNVQNLKVLNSSFIQSTSSKGSFFYINSFSNTLNINFENTEFSEGFSLIDGGAIFIDTSGAFLVLDFKNCSFSDIYTLSPNGNSIDFEKQSENSSQQHDILAFQDGKIQNIYGMEDSYFLKIKSSSLGLQNIQYKQQDQAISNSKALKKFKSYDKHQLSGFFNITQSVLKIKGSNFTNLQMLKSETPMLVSSISSQIYFQNGIIKDCIFSSYLIFAGAASNIILENTSFESIHQHKDDLRLIQNLITDQKPSNQSSSMIHLNNGSLKITKNSLFKDIKCTNNCNGGAFQLIKSKFDIQDSIFDSVKASFGGSIFVSGIINDRNNMQQVIFKNCKALYNGGSLYLLFQQDDFLFNLTIKQVQFISNESEEGRGGAVFVQSLKQNPQDQILQITDSQFIRNKALVGGAIYQINMNPKLLGQNIFSDNQYVYYGKDIISYPTNLKFVEEQSFLQNFPSAKLEKGIIFIESFRSGASIQDIIFEFQNQRQEKMIPVSQDEIDNWNIEVKIKALNSSENSLNLQGEQQVFYDQDTKSFKFKELKIFGKPGQLASLQFRSNNIYTLSQTTNTYIQDYSYNIQISFRECIQGEEKNTFNNIIQCNICEPGTYSLSVSKGCQECLEGALCQGGSNLITKQGYWRKSLDSENVLKCYNLPANCIGGSYGNQSCYEGHIGALCEECDLQGDQWGDYFAKSGKYQCIRCSEIKYNIWLSLISIIWTLISMSLAIKGNMDQLKQSVAALAIQRQIRYKSYQRNQSSLNLSSNLNQQNQTNDKSGVYIKLFTNYIQIVSSIATFNLSIPQGIFEFPQTVGSPTKQIQVQFDCIIRKTDIDIPIIYTRLIFSMLFPIFYMIIFLLGIFLLHCIRKEKKFDWFVVSTSAIFLIIYMQPDLVAQIIALMSCRTIGDTDYILSNVSFECYTEEHKYYTLILMFPLLLLWVLILPITLFVILVRNKQKLDSIDAQLKLGFLYKEYKNQAFYWEFVKMFQKIAIILALNFYSQEIVVKGVLVYIIIVIYGIISMRIHPYKESQINEIDVNSTNVCAITVLIGIFLYKNPFDYFVYFSFSLILIINIWLICKILNRIIKIYLTKIKIKLKHYIQKLSEKFPVFKKLQIIQKEKKQINDQLKKKIQLLFRKYLNMSSQQKKQFFLKIMESELVQKHGHIFKHESQYISQELSHNHHLNHENMVPNTTTRIQLITSQKLDCSNKSQSQQQNKQDYDQKTLNEAEMKSRHSEESSGFFSVNTLKAIKYFQSQKQLSIQMQTNTPNNPDQVD
ncbi:transmembrane protein, putative (macronuclear) [Tetrahymena thermophila SB210]|uniref:Transmembrane protein, putative n=1 Tax=Tetrahymena thermophila (strain SB210) TaxID=312017 RepID=W7XJJ7_TETTS|nr:transmembrane protein, putative [Tetrahymena thermophila SB210]EWS75586.1 transmembrane protein, putative [Tetrahymena thermophila SB210]|eukprot:XP_012651886.1 transmembrane protein, putative [Tetrahymena thermophila SB210]